MEPRYIMSRLSEILAKGKERAAAIAAISSSASISSSSIESSSSIIENY